MISYNTQYYIIVCSVTFIFFRKNNRTAHGLVSGPNVTHDHYAGFNLRQEMDHSVCMKLGQDHGPFSPCKPISAS